jgi:hypothetical protein
LYFVEDGGVINEKRSTSPITTYLYGILTTLIVIFLIYYQFFYNREPVDPTRCVVNKHSLTDSEFIELALERMEFYGDIKFDNSIKNSKEFFKKHPQCCHVDRKIKNEFSTWIWSADTVTVTLFFPRSEKSISASSFNRGDYEMKIIVMSYCGDVGEETGSELTKERTPFANE